jgi:hypothetical protein
LLFRRATSKIGSATSGTLELNSFAKSSASVDTMAAAAADHNEDINEDLEEENERKTTTSATLEIPGVIIPPPEIKGRHNSLKHDSFASIAL